MSFKVKMIAAVATNGVIGKDNTLPWRLPKDMKFFAEETTGNVVIMGRKSWDSLPAKFKPLPQRLNMIISRQSKEQLGITDPTVEVFDNVLSAIQKAETSNGKIYIIGGAEIYKAAMPYVNELIITEVKAEIDGDTYFPTITSDFTEISRVENKADEKHKYDFDFVTYHRLLNLTL